MRELHLICTDCGAVFTAKRRDRQVCDACRRIRHQQALNRSYAKRGVQLGVGRGAYERTQKPFQCKDCGRTFMASRRAERCDDCWDAYRRANSTRYEAARKERGRRVRRKLSCAVCGTEFVAHRTTVRYCSTTCRAEAKQQRAAARQPVYERYEATNRESGACIDCGQPTSRVRAKRCRACQLKAMSTGRDPLVHLRSRLQRTYGITMDHYNALLAEQGNACAICRTEFGAGVKVCVDHDHETNEVRGLLCSHCNTGIGMLRERYFEAAMAYLTKTIGKEAI